MMQDVMAIATDPTYSDALGTNGDSNAHDTEDGSQRGWQRMDNLIMAILACHTAANCDDTTTARYHDSPNNCYVLQLQ
jgi:hypothetical protein